MNRHLEAARGRLEKLVRQRFQQDTAFDQADIRVRVRAGSAYLAGRVVSLRQKRLAGEMAARVEGVGTVVNELRVAAMVHVDDDTLRDRIFRAFAANRRVNVATIMMEVARGTVYLRGFAKSMPELCACEEEAGATPGVERVVSRIGLRTERPRSESEVARDILDGLTGCLGLDPEAVQVTVEDGVVRLSGVVADQRTKSTAEEIACWTPSVREVVNALNVVPHDRTSNPSALDERRATIAAGP